MFKYLLHNIFYYVPIIYTFDTYSCTLKYPVYKIVPTFEHILHTYNTYIKYTNIHGYL